MLNARNFSAWYKIMEQSYSRKIWNISNYERQWSRLIRNCILNTKKYCYSCPLGFMGRGSVSLPHLSEWLLLPLCALAASPCTVPLAHWRHNSSANLSCCLFLLPWSSWKDHLVNLIISWVILTLFTLYPAWFWQKVFLTYRIRQGWTLSLYVYVEWPRIQPRANPKRYFMTGIQFIPIT